MGINIERAVPGKSPPSNVIAVYFDYSVKCTVDRTMFKVYRLLFPFNPRKDFINCMLPGIINAIFTCDTK